MVLYNLIFDTLILRYKGPRIAITALWGLYIVKDEKIVLFFAFLVSHYRHAYVSLTLNCIINP